MAGGEQSNIGYIKIALVVPFANVCMYCMCVGSVLVGSSSSSSAPSILLETNHRYYYYYNCMSFHRHLPAATVHFYICISTPRGWLVGW